ncbi:MAG: hypothetical protein RLZ18_601 [Actinomycetota bacterium]
MNVSYTAQPMILVDECRWDFKEYQMCHMVSDTSLDELHAFAEMLEIPRRAFHADHYDVPQHIRDKAVENGAQPVSSRELVNRLRAAGLRCTAAQRRAYKHGDGVAQGSAASVSDRGQ